MNRFRWAYKEFQWLSIRALHSITGVYYINDKKYAGVGLHPVIEGNDYLYNKILEGKPFASGRCGFSEMGLLACAQSEVYFRSKVHYYWTPSYINGKHFLSDKSGRRLREFSSIMHLAINGVDAIGLWNSMPMCDAVLETSEEIKDKFLFNADAIGSFLNDDHSWTRALKGKRVLVVSPFYKEILEQYKIRERIYPNGNLPEFELSCDPSIWFIDDPRFEEWPEALEFLFQRIMKNDFDIALLGCGGFGMPLAARIKMEGRQAIQTASATQLLFGIKGKRWDDRNYYNEYWIRPGKNTMPSNAKTLDNRTYW